MTFLAKESGFSSLFRMAVLAALALLITTANSAAQAASKDSVDVLVLSNGDTLHGKLVSEVGGKVTFHTDSLGDVSVERDLAANFTHELTLQRVAVT